MITDLTVLSRNKIVALLEASGYNETSSDIIEADYVNHFNGQVKYLIKYCDIHDNICHDYIYIFIRDGKIVADY